LNFQRVATQRYFDVAGFAGRTVKLYLEGGKHGWKPANSLGKCSRPSSGCNPTSGIDAVDGSSTGTSVPWMWALLRLPRFEGA
jgi:hypothetical protein